MVSALVGPLIRQGPPRGISDTDAVGSHMQGRYIERARRRQESRFICIADHGRMVEIGRFGRFLSRFLAVKHRIGAYDGLLWSHVVPSTR